MNLLQLSHHCISVVLLQESHRGPFPLETARSIDEVKPSFLVGRRNIARSVTVTIPTTLSLESTIGSLRNLILQRWKGSLSQEELLKIWLRQLVRL